MAFKRPTLSEIVTRLSGDIESRLPAAQVRRSNAVAYSRALAGAIHGLYGYIAWAHRQQFFDTAESEYLDRWGSIFGLTRKQASKALGSVTFSFSADPVNVPRGTILQSDAGVQFQTTGDVSSAGVASVQALQAGIEGNMLQGDQLTLVSPIAGVVSQVTVNGIAAGADAESDDSLRERLLARVRQPPMAGTAPDYKEWALEVPGVTRAWVYPLEDGVATVVIRFVCDELSPITPDSEMVSRVQEYIDTVRPVATTVRCAAPTVQPVNITISSLDPDSEAVKAAVTSELRDMFNREASPGGRILVSHIRAAISLAAGEIDHTLVSPVADIVPTTGVLLTLGTITWQ